MQQAIQFHNNGQLPEAQSLYRKVLRAKPKNSLALQGLGQIEMSLENYSAALSYFTKATKANPKNSDVWCSLGKAYLKLRKGDQSAESFTKAIQLDPGNADALFHMATLIAKHHPQDALRFLNLCIQKTPDNLDAYVETAIILRGQGKLKEASEFLIRCLSRKPDFAPAHNQLGRVFFEAKKPDESIASFKRAIQCDPKSPEAYSNLAVIMIKMDRMNEGLEILDEALRQDPMMPEAHNNRGVILRAQGQIRNAMRAYDYAIASHPGYVDAMTNMANCYQDLNIPHKSLEYLRMALDRDPDFGMAYYNMAFPLFMTGQMADGWTHYETRFKHGSSLPDRTFKYAQRWNGQDLNHKTIMVWREQGIGDEFGFISCLKDLIANYPDAHILYETEDRLIDVIQRSFPSVSVRSQQCYVSGREKNQVEDYDFHIPVGSLPGVYRRHYQDFPEHTGFITPDPDLTDLFKARIEKLGDGLKIGICWRSGLEQVARGSTNTEIETAWGDILALKGCHFINLQYGDYEDVLVKTEQKTGVIFHRWDDVDLKEDIDKVFAIMQNCDLVITPTTTVAHMSGALDIPTFVIAWAGYWPLFGTNKKPYYPTQHYFLTDSENDDGQNRARTMTDLAHVTQQAIDMGSARPLIRPLSSVSLPA